MLESLGFGSGHNVVAYLPPTTDHPAEKSYVMLGAHYDHLGRGDESSLAKADEAGDIHNGADDNASGVAAVLAAGAELATRDRARGIILAFWSGEEIGLLGSAVLHLRCFGIACVLCEKGVRGELD